MNTFKLRIALRAGGAAIFGMLLFGLPSAKVSAGVLLQGFYFDAPSDQGSQWWDRLAGQSQSIANSGFTAVWIPPVLKGSSGGYSSGYDPFDDYDIGSKEYLGTVPTKWGSRDNLLRSVAMMRANGLQVYVDMVIAHRKGDSGDKSFRYRDAYGGWHGRFAKSWLDFNSEDSEWGRALNFSQAYVRDQLKFAGDWLVKTLGTQGVRMDFAKGVPGEYLKEYLGFGALSKQLAITEYWSEDVDFLSRYVHEELQNRSLVFDFPLWGKLKDMSNKGGLFDMRNLVRAGLAGRDPHFAVTFVENHDTDRGFPTLQNKHLGYAYILTSEGYPSVFWKDYFEYGMKGQIDNLIWIHEALAKGSTEYRWTDEDLLAYERTEGVGLFVALNDNQQSARREWIQTRFGAHQLLHDYSGHGPDLWTDGDGKAWIEVPPNSFVAYSRPGVQWAFPEETSRITQEIVGASDLDIRPADATEFHQVAQVYLQENQSFSWHLFFDSNQWSESARIWLQVLSPDGKVIDKQALSREQNGHERGFWVPSRGWYRVEVKSQGTPEGQPNTPFWLQLHYQAPRSF